MKFYIHHLYLLLSVVALVVCMCQPTLITFGNTDLTTTQFGNFGLRMVELDGQVAVSAVSPSALGVLLIVSIIASVFTMFVSLFQNFSLQKRSAIFNCCVLAGYYIVMLVFVLILRADTSYVSLSWQLCLPLVSLIFSSMTFYSVRLTEAKLLARANNFRLRE